MDVRMMLQGLAPGMENHGHAELGAEIAGIGRDGGERLRGHAEQHRIDRGLVLEGDLADRRRQCEDNISSSACRSASHRARAKPWHLGQ